MTIKDTRKGNAVPFRTLKNGTVFTFNDVFYMVIEEVATLDVIDNEGGVDYWFNSVRLSDGGVVSFKAETLVLKVDAELIIN